MVERFSRRGTYAKTALSGAIAYQRCVAAPCSTYDAAPHALGCHRRCHLFLRIHNHRFRQSHL